MRANFLTNSDLKRGLPRIVCEQELEGGAVQYDTWLQQICCKKLAAAGHDREHRTDSVNFEIASH